MCAHGGCIHACVYVCVHWIFVVNISLIFSYSYTICMLNFKLKNLYIFRASLDVLKPPCGLFHRPLLSIYAKGQQALCNRLSTPGNENWVFWSYFICFSKSWCLRNNEFMHCSSPTNYCPIIIRLDYHVLKNQRKLIVLVFGWPFVNVIHCIGIVMLCSICTSAPWEF